MSDIVNVRSTIAANGGVVVIRTGGMPVVGIELEGTWAGTLHLRETVSGDGFVDGQVTNAAGTPVSAVVTGNGKFFVAAAGRSAIQVIATAWTSGTATVVGVPTLGSAGGSSGGGGGAITAAAGSIVDGADLTLGATTDAAATTDTGTFSVVSLFKRGLQKLTTLLGVLPAALVGGRLDVNLGAAGAGVSVGVNKIPGTISSVNSSTATLTSGAVFTGTAEDVSGVAAIIVNVFADVAGTLAPEFSSDGTHWDGIGSHAITAATFAVFEFRPGAQWFRLVYTNGGTNQATMRLQTIYHQDDVQLATVMALAAGMPNPTTEQIGADLLVQTGGGTTWAPAKADSSNRPVIASDDGSLNTLGTTTDAGIITNIAGTAIAFLRGSIIQWAAFLARFPAALISGRLDVNLGAAPAAVTIGTNAALVAGSATIGAVTQASGPWTANGPGANQAAVSGNPNWIAGSTTAAGGNLQGLMVESAANPNLRATLFNGAGQVAAGGGGDNTVNSTTGLLVQANTSSFNGTGNDRIRNNVDVTLLASAARTTLQNSANITVYNCKGIIVTVDVTATVSTVSLTPSINYIDPASGKAIPLLTGTTIAAAGTFTYWVDEAALASVPAPFTKTAQAALGRIITVNIAVGNANSQTYSVGYTLIP